MRMATNDDTVGRESAMFHRFCRPLDDARHNLSYCRRTQTYLGGVFEMKEIEQVRAVPCGPYGPNEKWSVMFPTRRENLVHRPSETRTPDATTGALDIVPGNPR